MKLSGLFGKKKKIYPCGAVIVAAGSASRMGGIDKLAADLAGETVLERSIRAFQENERISEIVVVTGEDRIQSLAETCARRGFNKVKNIVPGGATRTDSVYAGLQALSKDVRLAAIHDGARPLVTQKIITEAIEKADETGAAAPAIPVKDTIKITENGVVVSTPARETLAAVQTPQVFDADLIRAAIFKAQTDGVPLTDDCMAVERIGMKVHLTAGAERNLKITTPPDLELAAKLLEEENL